MSLDYAFRFTALLTAPVFNPGSILASLALSDASPLLVKRGPDLLGGIVKISGEARAPNGGQRALSAIPYNARGHRRDGEMNV